MEARMGPPCDPVANAWPLSFAPLLFRLARHSTVSPRSSGRASGGNAISRRRVVLQATRGLSPATLARVAAGHPNPVFDGRTFAPAPRTAGGAAQYVARSVSAPPDDKRHERRWRAMLAPLAVDPQPWRDASKVREGGNGGGGRPAHRQSIAPFAPPGKPRGLVARLRRCRYIQKPCPSSISFRLAARFPPRPCRPAAAGCMG